jgi:hypothetical protein
MENANVQDNQIFKYTVDFEKQELLLNTRSKTNEFTDILFSDLIAYFFEDTITSCTILDLEEWPAEDFISYLGETYLMEHRKYDWPFEFDDLADFKTKLSGAGITIYNLASSHGMSGFILAKSLKYIPKKK